MNGYFISEKNAKELGLLQIESFAKNSQKTIIAITEKDIEDYQGNDELPAKKLDKKRKNEMSDWFYKNYYETLMESLNEYWCKQ